MAKKEEQNAVMDYLNMYAIRIYNNGKEVSVYVQSGKDTEQQLENVNNALSETGQNISLSEALKCDTNTYDILHKVYLESVKEEHRREPDIW